MNPFDMLRCEINAFMNYANFPNIYSIYLISTLLDRVDIRKIAQFIKAFISQRNMSNGFIYVVNAHFIDKIEKKTNILDPSVCGY